MQEDLAVLVGFGVRESGTPAEAEAAAFLRESLEGLGIEVEVGEVPLPNDRTSSNLVASFGDGLRHVVLGAHYDSKPPSPGADDNGSGTVVLLELARRLGVVPSADLRVTIVFFGAEEILVGHDRNSHHFGSRLLAQQMADDVALPDFMVSADMIGVGDRIVAATYFDSDPGAATLTAEAAANLGLAVAQERRGDISDHEAFARLGVPSVFLWRPDNPDYHLASDREVRTEALLEDLAILEEFLSLVAAGS
jgi:Zn-dependent M28 family amino/carboxypeptidase